MWKKEDKIDADRNKECHSHNEAEERRAVIMSHRLMMSKKEKRKECEKKENKYLCFNIEILVMLCFGFCVILSQHVLIFAHMTESKHKQCFT